jgi:hypothetical protein
MAGRRNEKSSIHKYRPTPSTCVRKPGFRIYTLSSSMPYGKSLNVPFGVELTQESGIDRRKRGRRCRVVRKKFPYRRNEVDYQVPVRWGESPWSFDNLYAMNMPHKMLKRLRFSRSNLVPGSNAVPPHSCSVEGAILAAILIAGRMQTPMRLTLTGQSLRNQEPDSRCGDQNSPCHHLIAVPVG